VITGFNTDIEFEGVTYHVQTEDKGLDSPLILSLVYVGGAILASKRTPYDDLVSSGYDEKVLTERLQRQHKLICAAIRSGRVADLKRMGGQNGSADTGSRKKGRASSEAFKVAGARKKKSEAAQPVVENPVVENATGENKNGDGAINIEPGQRREEEIVILTTMMDEITALSDVESSPEYTFRPPPRIAPPVHDEFLVEEESFDDAQPQREETTELPQDGSDELYLILLDDEGDFRAGQLATIKVHVGRGTYGQRPVASASVTVKVLGTTFRPMIQTTETDERGVAVVRALLPRFNAGRAAIIIRAADRDDAVEMRRIIHQS